MAAQFSEEQLKELEKIYGLVRMEETAPVRDGRVVKSDMVWWRSVTGPERVKAGDQWTNLTEHPHVYQIAEPRMEPARYLD